MEGIRGPVIAGLDTHKKEHALCLLDGLGRKVFEGLFPANERGYSAVAEAIGEPGGCIVVFRSIETALVTKPALHFSS